MKKLLSGILAKIFGGNAKKTRSNEYGNIPTPDDRQIKEVWIVPETPFCVIKMENSYFVTFREYRLTDPVNSIIEAWNDATHPGWQLHINLMNAIILTHDTMKEELRKTDVATSNKKFMSNLTKN